MPYTAHNWVSGDSANATRLNNLESQYTESTLSFGPDLFTAGFVLSGFTATKDGINPKQLDVTSGTAYLLQADGTTRQRKFTVGSTQTTSALSSTYYLYLQPDGTWYWSTANTPAANSLAICQVTTDGSGNISTVTDERPLNATALSTMAGALTLPTLSTLTVAGASSVGGTLTVNTGASAFHPIGGTNNDSIKLYAINTSYNAAIGFSDGTDPWTPGLYAFDNKNGGIIFRAGTKTGIFFNAGFTGVGAQPTAGSLGVPVIVASVIRQTISDNAAHQIISVALSSNGLYRISAGAYISCTAGTIKPLFEYSYVRPDGSASPNKYVIQAGAPTSVLDGSSTIVANGADLQLMPTVFQANAGTLTVTYQEASGTVADVVSVIIERLG